MGVMSFIVTIVTVVGAESTSGMREMLDYTNVLGWKGIDP